MDINIIYKHPWQNGPAEIIKFSLNLLIEGLEANYLDSLPEDYLFGERGNIGKYEFNNLLAFLFLDIGVETMLKVYLGLPDDIIEANEISFSERCKASKGKFHDVIECVFKCLGSKADEINMAHIQNYHRIRNKLYHEGDGITIPFHTAKEYAGLAVKLLDIALDVDLNDLFKKLEISRHETNSMGDNDIKKVNVLRQKLFAELRFCIESLVPELLYPSYRNKLMKSTSEGPLKAMWVVCDLVESIFSVDFDDCLSENDIEKVNKILRETSDTDITQYPTKKEVVFRIMSGYLDWSYPEIKNLPVRNYIVNSISVKDFIDIIEPEEIIVSDYFVIFLKMVCEIIDKDVAEGKYKCQINSLTEIAIKNNYFDNYYVFESDEEIEKDIEILHSTIKKWRNECVLYNS